MLCTIVRLYHVQLFPNVVEGKTTRSRYRNENTKNETILKIRENGIYEINNMKNYLKNKLIDYIAI